MKGKGGGVLPKEGPWALKSEIVPGHGKKNQL